MRDFDCFGCLMGGLLVAIVTALSLGAIILMVLAA